MYGEVSDPYIAQMCVASNHWSVCIFLNLFKSTLVSVLCCVLRPHRLSDKLLSIDVVNHKSMLKTQANKSIGRPWDHTQEAQTTHLRIACDRRPHHFHEPIASIVEATQASNDLVLREGS